MRNLKSYEVTASGGSAYADNLVVFTGVAPYVQLRNDSSTNLVRVRVNGDAASVFNLHPSETQILENMNISQVEIDNSASGSTSTEVEILTGELG